MWDFVRRPLFPQSIAPGFRVADSLDGAQGWRGFLFLILKAVGYSRGVGSLNWSLCLVSGGGGYKGPVVVVYVGEDSLLLKGGLRDLRIVSGIVSLQVAH